MSVTLSRINLFPVKSLDGIAVPSAAFTSRGGLVHDRRFELVDAQGELINGKRTPRVHDVLADYDLDESTISLTIKASGRGATFSLEHERRPLERWLSDFFNLQVSIREDVDGGFPDDLEAPGPTIVSTATLAAVANWFPGLTVDDVRRRFRANLELECSEAFWEDHLYADETRLQRFQIGAVQFAGTNPCQRCPVPARSAATGEVWPAFARQFSDHRQSTLPPWATASRFDHYYRLAVNTRIVPGPRGEIAVGDEVSLGRVEPR